MPLSSHRSDRSPSDPRVDAIEAFVLPLVQQQAGDLGECWTAQARAVLLLDGTDRQGTARAIDTRGLVETLIANLSNGHDVSEKTIGQGMQFGAAAFERGVSIHHVLKAVDLLMAMLLLAVESALEQADGGLSANAADGVRLSRRFQRRGTLVSLAATRGYMQAYAETLRNQFRHLRHDLRNPLGTIKSVLALMEDDSVPLEARANPTFRGMAARNARLLEELIANRLDDAVAIFPTIAVQEVSVHAIACAVQRELRTEAERRGVTIVVGKDGPYGWLDAAGLDLLLYEVLQATLRESELGERLHVELFQAAGRANLAISCESGHSTLRAPYVLERLSALAGLIGATIAAGERTLISIPLRTAATAPSAERGQTVPRDSDGLRDGEVRHDVRSSREGYHGQPRAR